VLFRDAKELGEGAGRLIDDPAEAHRLGDAGRRFVALHYRWNAVVGRLEKLLATVAGPGRMDRPADPR
jgi:glycosyltransferase involved in cell wall biosynthesis